MLANDYINRILLNEEHCKLVMEITEKICEILEKDNISRKQLAEKLNTTERYVNDLLEGDIDINISTLSNIFFVLNCRIKIHTEKID